MTARDDLAALIGQLRQYEYAFNGDIATDQSWADAILAAGWRPADVTPEDIHQHSWWIDGHGNAQCVCGNRWIQ